MQLWEEKALERMEGREEGIGEGEELFAALTERLLKDSRTDDLLKAANDREFRYALYREYGLKASV